MKRLLIFDNVNCSIYICVASKANRYSQSKTMDEIIEQIFVEAKDIFFLKECDNILSDIAERNLCGRLSIYLTCKLKEHNITGYFADTEYNRKQGGQVKTILDEDINIITIQSDLIVHSRGNIIEQDNLLSIEMKKSTRPESEKITDRKRLRAMTKTSYDNVWSADGQTYPEHVCGYLLGIYIILNIVARTYTLEFYRHGEQIDLVTKNF